MSRPGEPAWDPAALASLGPRGARLGYLIETALAEDRPQDAVAALLEAADALLSAGEPAATAETLLRVALDAAHRGPSRRARADVAWRLAQLREAGGHFVEAASLFEDAADGFRADGASLDQAVALQASARCRLKTEGPAEALQMLQDAVDLVRDSGDDRAFASAMEQFADAASEARRWDEAGPRYREAVSRYRAVGDSSGVLRSTIGMAEAVLAGGDHLRAIEILSPVEGLLEAAGDAATTGRGAALLARFYLRAERMGEARTSFVRAVEHLERAGSALQQADLMLDFGRAIEVAKGPSAAIDFFMGALERYAQVGALTRVGPAAYNLAKAYLASGQPVKADFAIERALEPAQQTGDLEGLNVCTQLAVRIALALDQFPLAVRRLRMGARVRANLGDAEGDVRLLLQALDVALMIPGHDGQDEADEFLEALHRAGTRFFAPGELAAVAVRLERAGRSAQAAEVVAVQAQAELNDQLYAEGARTLVEAAGYAVRGDARARAGELYDQAIAIGERFGVREVKEWRIDRDLFGS